MLFGPMLGGLAAGLGSMLYDALFGGYDFINCLVTFVSKFLMAAICAWIAFGGKEEDKGKHVRLVVGSVVGALSYVALYMLKTYIFQRFVHGYPLDAVVVTMGGRPTRVCRLCVIRLGHIGSRASTGRRRYR